METVWALPFPAPAEVTLNVDRGQIVHAHRAHEQDLDRDGAHHLDRCPGRLPLSLCCALRQAARKQEQQFDVVGVIELGKPAFVLVRHAVGLDLDAASGSCGAPQGRLPASRTWYLAIASSEPAMSQSQVGGLPLFRSIKKRSPSLKASS